MLILNEFENVDGELHNALQDIKLNLFNGILINHKV